MKSIFSFIKNAVIEVFSLDLRSLALLRICTGLLLLADLTLRARDFFAFYTDNGILPHIQALGQLAPFNFSFHAMNGTWQFEAVLFIVQVVFAVFLIVGYKTRFSTIVSWILLISLQNRTQLVNAADDVLLRLMLFWAIFLPWGALYSLDSVYKNYVIPKMRVFSAATIAFIAQIALVYWCTHVMKYGADWVTDSTAVSYTLHITQMTTPFGNVLAKVAPQQALTLLTQSVVLLEGYAPFLFFVPIFNGFFRIIGILLFLSFHMGLAASLWIGLFSFIISATLLGLLPSLFWDTIFRFLKTKNRTNLTIFYDGGCGFCQNSVRIIKTFFLFPETQLLPAQSDLDIEKRMTKHNSWVIKDAKGAYTYQFDGFIAVAKASPLLFIFVPIFNLLPCRYIGNLIYRFVATHRATACPIDPPIETRSNPTHTPFLTNCVVYFFLLYVLAFNLSTLPATQVHMNPQFLWIAQITRVDQSWGMFAPSVYKDDGYMSIPGKLANGATVDLFQDGAPYTTKMPTDFSKMYKNYRWRKFTEQIYVNNSTNRTYFAQYYCRNWNGAHSGSNHLDSLTIDYMLYRNLPNNQKAPRRDIQLAIYTCPRTP